MKRNPEKNRKSILRRIGVISVLVAVAAIFLSGVILFSLFRKQAFDNIRSSLQVQVQGIRTEFLYYDCRFPLIEYWIEHVDEIELPGEDYEEWNKAHEVYAKQNLSVVTEEEFLSMTEEEKKLFAESCYFNLYIELAEAFSINKCYAINCVVPDENGEAPVLFGITKNLAPREVPLGEKRPFHFDEHPVAKEYWNNNTEWLFTSDMEIFRLPMDGEIYAAVYSDVGNMEKPLALLSEMVSIREVMNGVWRNVLTFELWISIVILGSLAGLLIAVYQRALKPVVRLQDVILTYARDKEREKLSENLKGLKGREDEFGRLASHVDDMACEIEEYYQNAIELTKVAQEQERINAELALAANIQVNALPKVFTLPDQVEKILTLYASMNPAKEVGGDYYDFFMIDQDHLALEIADVSGKGIPAAMFMMLSKNLIYSYTMREKDPAKALELANEKLIEGNEDCMFVTVWLGILELSTGKMVCSNGGHEYPVIKKKTGKYEMFMDPHGLAVGLMEGSPCSDYELRLEPGDRLFVYTDGLPEATRTDNEMFGMERLTDALNQVENAAPEPLIDHMIKAVDDFIENAEQFDDLTMLSLEYHGLL